MLKQETVLYPTNRTSNGSSAAYLKEYNKQPKTLAEAESTIASLLQVVQELQLREDVAVQGRVAAHLGIPVTENPYSDKDQRGMSLELIWADSHSQEREHYVAKDRLARIGDLMIAAVTLKNLVSSSPTKEQAKAIKLFDLSLARLREQTGV